MKKTVQENLQNLPLTTELMAMGLPLHFECGETTPDIVDFETNGALYIHGDDLPSLIAVLQDFVK